MLVCHHCDNRKCVNPEHLFLGTVADNNADKESKGRSVVLLGSENGRSKLVEDDIPKILDRLGSGARQVDVAEEFGVSQAVISTIKRGVRWTHALTPTRR
jgi:hypothetical protein